MKLDRRNKWMLIITLLALTGLLLNGCSLVDKEDEKVYRVGLLASVEVFNVTIHGFKAEMAELGYVEGENITYDFQQAGGDTEKMGQIAEQFVADEVDLILTTSTPGAKAAKAATADSGIPVIFTIVADPLGPGVVGDLRKPGGNVTGVSRPLGSYMGKRVEYMLQMAPDVKRIWIPFDPDYPTVGISLPAVQQAALALGVELVETPVNSPEEVLADLEKRSTMDDIGFDAIQIMPDITTQNTTSWQAILAFANEHGLPIAGNVPGQVEQGALFSYSDDNYETGQFAAPIADKILRGEDPGTIPVVFAEPRLFINYKTAQALGLTIDDGLLNQAVEVIR